MSHDVVRPPPPPMPNSTISQNDSQKNVAKRNNFMIPESDCKWAEKYPELRISCARFGVCVHRIPYKVKYKHIESLLQEGPTCGLVSIAMLLDHKITPKTLLTVARSKKYSMNGELFSVQWMSSLINVVLSETYSNLRIEVKKMKLFSIEVVQLLADGCLLLVPYDCDRNHTPCLKKGHKAHWAIITGVIITDPFETLNDLSPEHVYVTAKHGKSLHVGVWRLYDLDKSNNNLEEFSPEREYDKLEYILPEGGLTTGLKGQFILIHPF